ncbi:MAG: hypothetical protein ACLQHK_05745 [Gallionellaceae bacterium]
MENMLSIKYVTYTIVSTLLFFGSPDKRSSEEIADDISAEEFSMHQEYDADSMPYYYDPGM